MSDGQKEVVPGRVGVYVSLRPLGPSLSPLRSTFQPSRSYLYGLRTGRITAVRGQFVELRDAGGPERPESRRSAETTITYQWTDERREDDI